MVNEKIKYFSMFTGVGGFELGIGERGECIGISENEKFCSELLANKYSDIKNYGDATTIIPEELPDFELLVGGFPCQSFSIAGKRKGFEDTRGTLFNDIVRILKVKRPSYILLENVKGLLSHDGGRTFAIILASLSKLGYVMQWMVLNSKFFGVPQNRERVFIIGSLRGFTIPEILPLGESCKEIDVQNKNEVAHTIDANYWKGANTYGSRTMIDASQAQRVYGTEGTSVTIKSEGGGQGAKTGLYMINAATKQGYSEAEVGDGIRLEYPESKTARGRVIKGTSNTLKSGTEGVVDEDMKIRRLTPIECERLQGFPDNWTKGFSDTQRYKMMGNAVTVNVIQALAKKLILSGEGDGSKS